MNVQSQRILRSGLILAIVAGSPALLSSQVLEIRLRPVVHVADREVQLSDIAELSTSLNPEFHQHVREADIAAFTASETLLLIRKSVVDVRLRLLGLQQHEYRLTGPDQLIVSRRAENGRRHRDPRFSLIASGTSVADAPVTQHDEPLTDLHVEQAIQASLEQQFELAPGEVKVRLLRPFVDDRMREQNAHGAGHIEVISSANFPYGRTNLTIRYLNTDQQFNSRTAFVDVRRKQRVLLARRTLRQNATIDDDDVMQEVRYVDEHRDELEFSDLHGLVPVRNIRSGSVLALSDFREASRRSSEDVIRSRDAVRIVGQRKGLRFVVPAAEALQSGSTGQLIRVRNLHSNRIVIARVTGRGEVEVPLE